MTVREEPSGGGWRCQVEVDHAGQSSRHSVTVTAADLERWGRGSGGVAVEDLVRRSFDFLLEREPPGAILKTFELAVINRYFPEYDREFRKS